jgi:hypothetical protein
MAYLHDFAHEFMAQDITRLHGRDIAVIEMQIRATDRREGDFDDGVMRVQNLWIRYGFEAHIVFAIPA